MPNAVQITLTPAGFEVTIGRQTDRFFRLDDAIAFAQERLSRAHHRRELSARIE